MNKIIITGRLVADPELRQTPSNVSVCRFRVAVQRNYVSESGERKADFFSCTAWRSQAEFICKYFKKGSAVNIEGKMQNADYTDRDGVKHYGMELLVENVEFGESKKAEQNSTASNNGGQPQTVITKDASDVDLSQFEEIMNDGECPF